jgi:hypothetical protein
LWIVCPSMLSLVAVPRYNNLYTNPHGCSIACLDWVRSFSSFDLCARRRSLRCYWCHRYCPVRYPLCMFNSIVSSLRDCSCFAYGGSKGRALYDPEAHPHRSLDAAVSKEQYMKESTPSLNHFYDKLLRLKDGMKTAAGQVLAQQRCV